MAPRIARQRRAFLQAPFRCPQGTGLPARTPRSRNSDPAKPMPNIAPQTALIALWIYVTLLLAGGLVGLIKAGSKISLVTSALFAALLALCATGVIHPFYITDILVGVLAVVFCVRYLKTSKFMPSGLMLLFSVVVLAVLLVDR